MWIAIDPDHPRRRIAFGDEERARSYADKLTPAWTGFLGGAATSPSSRTSTSASGDKTSERPPTSTRPTDARCTMNSARLNPVLSP